MCILCDSSNLRLLVVRLDSLDAGELVDAISVAREAAMQVVLDLVDAIPEGDATGIGLSPVPLDAYLEYVVERAEREGLIRGADARGWKAGLQDRGALDDPRVQAFLSSAAEGLASYLVQIEEHRAVLQRFLEVSPEAIAFAGVGEAGEAVFSVAGERYMVLGEQEALRVVMDRLMGKLWEEEPDRLLPYTALPAGSVDYLADAQKRPREEANEILASMVDLESMAEDAVRRHGYALYIAEGVAEEYTEQRFADRVVVRLRGEPDVD